MAETAQPEFDPHAASIATELWRWNSLRESEQNVVDPKGNLAQSLERYMGTVFSRIEFTRSRGLWCDGVVGLAVSKVDQMVFQIVGAAYCPTDLAPFEMEFHFAKQGAANPARVVFRFGELDQRGELRLHSYTQSAFMVVSKRPRSTSDWAVAVELTAESY